MATRNLRDALRRIRTVMTNETKDIQLWIDAACINQADKTEKSWQVNIMSRIYSNCYGLHVWLGLADHNAQEAMLFVSTVGSPTFDVQDSLTEALYVDMCENFINRCQKEEGKGGLDALFALEDIFHHRQYWKRAWTFQEFCLRLDGIMVWGLVVYSFICLWIHLSFQRFREQGQKGRSCSLC